MTSTNNIKKVVPNHSKRHFTIVREDGTKYRTTVMSKVEFQEELNNTLNDWKQYLKTDNYYKI